MIRYQSLSMPVMVLSNSSKDKEKAEASKNETKNSEETTNVDDLENKR